MVKGTDNLKAEDPKEPPQILLAHTEVLEKTVKFLEKFKYLTSEFHVKFHAKNRCRFLNEIYNVEYTSLAIAYAKEKQRFKGENYFKANCLELANRNRSRWITQGENLVVATNFSSRRN